MAIRFEEIGQRLRAYRLGSSLGSEEIARRLGISRAALYRYEKGEVIKIETIERLAELLGVSLPSLLGVGVEYYANALSYFERMRQLETRSRQVIAHFEPISWLLTSADYSRHLRQMLLESIPRGAVDRGAAERQAADVMEILDARKAEARSRGATIVSLVSLVQLERFLRIGMIGSFDLPAAIRAERRRAARREVAGIADLMENEPIGVQVGVVEDVLPSQTFQIFRQAEGGFVAVSPFRLGELPNIRIGVASVTATREAVELYEKVADDLWRQASKGARGADQIRALVARVDAGRHLDDQAGPLRAV